MTAPKSPNQEYGLILLSLEEKCNSIFPSPAQNVNG